MRLNIRLRRRGRRLPAQGVGRDLTAPTPQSAPPHLPRPTSRRPPLHAAPAACQGARCALPPRPKQVSARAWQLQWRSPAPKAAANTALQHHQPARAAAAAEPDLQRSRRHQGAGPERAASWRMAFVICKYHHMEIY